MCLNKLGFRTTSNGRGRHETGRCHLVASVADTGAGGVVTGAVDGAA